MTTHSSSIKSQFLNFNSREILQKDVTILIGIDDKIKAVLAKIGITTVFDLASSRYFANAKEIVRASSKSDSLINRYGGVPSQIIDSNVNEEVDEMYKLPVEKLFGISDAVGRELKSLLHVNTIYDFANWAPYLAANSIMIETLLPENTLSFDPESPPDLIPKTGDYPTEKVYYTKVVIDEVEDDQQAKELGDEQVDLNLLLKKEKVGFTKPAVGALITVEQSWYNQGVALGNLLHSLALAPAESTKIAVIDWSRRESGQQSEFTNQTEELTSDLIRARGISETTEGVAREMQRGESTLSSNTRSTSSATSKSTSTAPPELIGEISGILSSIGGLVDPSKFGQNVTDLIGGGIEGIVSGFGNGIKSLFGGGKDKKEEEDELVQTTLESETFGESTNQSNVHSVSSSSGERELFSKTTQNVRDRTQQHANSARTRRASVIREVSQSESERISTRTVTNYNHMHALTVQYYEMVQIYRTTTRIRDVEKVLFVPMKPIDTWTKDLILRFRKPLFRYALDLKFKALMLRPEINDLTISNAGINLNDEQDDYIKAVNGMIKDRYKELRNYGIIGNSTVEDFIRNPKLTNPNLSIGAIEICNNIGPTPSPFAGNSFIDRLNISTITGANYLVRPNHGNMIRTGIPFSAINGMNMTVNGLTPAPDAPVVVCLRPKLFPELVIPITVKPPKGEDSKTESEDVVTNAPTINDEDYIFQHLEENSSYYSQVIWNSLDDLSLSLLFSRYKYKGKPLLQQVDTMPIARTANYIGFRMNADYDQDQEWKTWLENHGFFKNGNFDDKAEHDLVPMPSGGVFAEAVLGRSNSAEKLDMTRFWNWQDSPIPINAPDIAAIQSGSRAQQIDLSSANLEGALVQLQNPPALPDFQGNTPTLNTLATSNMFRDMSGLATNAMLAQASIEAASQAAVAAQNQAGANMATLGQFIVERLKVSSDLLKSIASMAATMYTGAPVSPGTETAYDNISNAGATYNQGEKIDAKKVESQNSNSGNIATGNSTSPTNNTSGILPNNNSSSNTSRSMEEEAFRNMIGSDEGVMIASANPNFIPSVDGGGTTETENVPEIIYRSEWGAKDFSGNVEKLGGYKDLVIHHSVTSAAKNKTEGLARVKEIQDIHMDDRKWSDLGYHFLVDSSGNIYQGRRFYEEDKELSEKPELAKGSHVEAQNTGKVGICLIGCYDENECANNKDDISKASLDAVVELCTFFCKNYNISSDNIKGHKDYKATACPGTKFYAKLSEIKESVKSKLEE